MFNIHIITIPGFWFLLGAILGYIIARIEGIITRRAGK